MITLGCPTVRAGHRFGTFDRWRYLFGTPVVAFLACSHSMPVPPGHPDSVQGPNLLFLRAPWQCARLPAHPPRSSLYRSSLVGTVICSRQLLGNNTLSYRTMSPIRSPLRSSWSGTRAWHARHRSSLVLSRPRSSSPIYTRPGQAVWPLRSAIPGLTVTIQ